MWAKDCSLADTDMRLAAAAARVAVGRTDATVLLAVALSIGAAADPGAEAAVRGSPAPLSGALNTALLPAVALVAAVRGVVEAVTLGQSGGGGTLGVLLAFADVVGVDLSALEGIEVRVVLATEGAGLAGVVVASCGRDGAAGGNDGDGLEDGGELHFDVGVVGIEQMMVDRCVGEGGLRL